MIWLFYPIKRNVNTSAVTVEKQMNGKEVGSGTVVTGTWTKERK